MDMQMPVMDGAGAPRARSARSHGLAALPIVAMTANAMEQDRTRCLEAGMNDFLTKPIDPDALWAVLAQWIRRSDHPVATSGQAAAPSSGQLSI